MDACSHAVTRQHNFVAAADTQAWSSAVPWAVFQGLCRAAAVAAAAEPGFLPLISSVVGVVAVKPRASSRAACAVFDCNQVTTATRHMEFVQGACYTRELGRHLLELLHRCKPCLACSTHCPWINMDCCFVTLPVVCCLRGVPLL